MDLLERARALAACPLFGALAPAVLVRLAERARAELLEPGERRTTDDTVWIVAAGSVASATAVSVAGAAAGTVRDASAGSVTDASTGSVTEASTGSVTEASAGSVTDASAGSVTEASTGSVTEASAGTVFGVIRIVRPSTPAAELVAETPATLIALAADDVRDILEEDPAALTALADRLAAELMS